MVGAKVATAVKQNLQCTKTFVTAPVTAASRFVEVRVKDCQCALCFEVCYDRYIDSLPLTYSQLNLSRYVVPYRIVYLPVQCLPITDVQR